MIALPLVLLVTVGREPEPVPAIAIDPCVDVDAAEVQRLATIELGTSRVGAAAARLDVAVGCTDGAQELRVTDRTNGLVTVRSIDLNARFEKDRDAKTRELALAIAEVVRRTELEREPPPPPAPPPAPRPVKPPPPRTERDAPSSEPRPWRAELGVVGAAARWTAGETLLGVDATGRLRFGNRLIADVRLGGRKTRPVELQSGTIDATGMSAAVGLSVDLAPFASGGGLALGVRLSGDWLRYSAMDEQGSQYGGGDAGALGTSATATAFLEISRPVSLTADAAVGTALHSIGIEDDGRPVSGMRGVLLSGALGVSAQF